MGRTGLQVSEVGFGAIHIIRLPLEEAVRVLHRSSGYPYRELLAGLLQNLRASSAISRSRLLSA
ncbi:MAG: hypothetical protein ACOZF2_08770 [Thermodesulfobacteriota bacterium]